MIDDLMQDETSCLPPSVVCFPKDKREYERCSLLTALAFAVEMEIWTAWSNEGIRRPSCESRATLPLCHALAESWKQTLAFGRLFSFLGGG